MTHIITYRWVRWVLALGWTAIITVFLLQSSGEPVVGPAAPPGEPGLLRELELTAGHIIGFGGLTLAWWWALHGVLRPGVALLATIGFSISYGVFTEVMQINIPDRNASWWDIFVNAGVTVLVAGVIWWWGREREAQREAESTPENAPSAE